MTFKRIHVLYCFELEEIKKFGRDKEIWKKIINELVSDEIEI